MKRLCGSVLVSIFATVTDGHKSHAFNTLRPIRPTILCDVTLLLPLMLCGVWKNTATV